MGTLPLSFEQESPPSLSYLFSTYHYPISNPSTPWSPSTSPPTNGLNWETTSPRPLASPLPRLSLALLSSITNIVVSMLVMKTPTLTSRMSSIPSSANTMVLVLTSNTPLTWMPPKSPPTLTPKSPSTPAESVSAVPSKDSVFPPASPSNNVLMLRPS